MKALLITACQCSQLIDIVHPSNEIVLPLPGGTKRRFCLIQQELSVMGIDVKVYNEDIPDRLPHREVRDGSEVKIPGINDRMDDQF